VSQIHIKQLEFLLNIFFRGVETRLVLAKFDRRDRKIILGAALDNEAPFIEERHIYCFAFQFPGSSLHSSQSFWEIISSDIFYLVRAFPLR